MKSIRVLAGAILLFAVAPAFAAAPVTTDGTGNGSNLLQELSQCATIADNNARLACYDRLSPRVKQAAEAGLPATARRQPTEQEQKSWFGFDIGDLFGTSPKTQTTPEEFGSETTQKAKQERAEEEPKTIDSISAGVTDYAFTSLGKFVVFLDNGQVWKQLQSDSGAANFKKKPSDNTVTITRGFLGSYNLTLNDTGGLMKVTRVK